MALVNILVKSTKDINWNNFIKDYSSLNISNIETFPIPKELGFDYDCIGVNIHKGYVDKEVVLNEIGRFIAFFRNEPYAFKFVELYNGLEIIPENLVTLMKKLLPA